VPEIALPSLGRGKRVVILIKEYKYFPNQLFPGTSKTFQALFHDFYSLLPNKS